MAVMTRKRKATVLRQEHDILTKQPSEAPPRDQRGRRRRKSDVSTKRCDTPEHRHDQTDGSQTSEDHILPTPVSERNVTDFPSQPDELLRDVQDILRAETAAINLMSKHLQQNQLHAFIHILSECAGTIIISGLGKSGHIAQKISSTFASLGTPSFFLHPAEAEHGDYGRIREGDVVILLSHSGKTREVVSMCHHIHSNNFGAKVLAITASADSPLGKDADLALLTGYIEEASDVLAPTSSTTAALALGDALALALLKYKRKPSGEIDLILRKHHPGGAIGSRLQTTSSIGHDTRTLNWEHAMNFGCYCND
jgi:D-arabinose 5-phosphate isomerase GutQ